MAYAGFSLSRALQLGLPALVAGIEEVSEYASKVRAEIDSMQVHPHQVLNDGLSWLPRSSLLAACCECVHACYTGRAATSLSLHSSTSRPVSCNWFISTKVALLCGTCRSSPWSALWTRCSQTGQVMEDAVASSRH